MSSTRSSALSEKVILQSTGLRGQLEHMWRTPIKRYHHLIFSQGMLGENSGNSVVELDSTTTRASEFARNLDNLYDG